MKMLLIKLWHLVTLWILISKSKEALPRDYVKLPCYKSFHLVSRNDDKKSNASATVLTGEIINKPGGRNIFLPFQCISMFHTQRPKCLRKLIVELDTRGVFRTVKHLWKSFFGEIVAAFSRNHSHRKCYIVWVLNMPLDTPSNLLYKLLRRFEKFVCLFIFKLNKHCILFFKGFSISHLLVFSIKKNHFSKGFPFCFCSRKKWVTVKQRFSCCSKIEF